MKLAIIPFVVTALALSACTGTNLPSEPRGLAGPVGPCTAQQICRFTNPEDLADFPGTDWILIAEQDHSASAAGEMTVLDVRTQRIFPLTGTADNPCGIDARAGGFGIAKLADGYRLARVLHGKSDAVEVFRITFADGVPVAGSGECVRAPEGLFLNDVAPDEAGGFVATHMFDRSLDRSELERRFLGSIATGHVVQWTPESGWAKIPGSEGSFPNGIALTSDGEQIVFTETYGHTISILARGGGGKRTIKLVMQPDNITRIDDARFIVAGGTGEPLKSTLPCATLREAGCGFPAAVLLVDFNELSSIQLVVSGGKSVPGPSVALQKDGKLYLGTAFGDRITVLEQSADPVQVP